VAHLKKRELVMEDAHKFLLLTTSGRRVARQVRRNYGILSQFFEEVLSVTPEVAQADACKMEHLVSLETGRRLLRLMEAILRERGSGGEAQGKVSWRISRKIGKGVAS
jgi:DtxR family transcriptional regulator, Mn-dependent transcriptional regulator